MSTKQLTDLDFAIGARIVGLLTPVAGGEPATKAYVDALLEGLSWKDNCRVRAASNINITSPGATIDAISMVALDRVCLAGQTTQSENGIYVWNGASTAMTRALDANTSDELENAVTSIDEGTSALSTFRQNTVNFTLGSGNVVWASFGTAAPAATETVAGVLEIATQAETNAATDDVRALTPLKASSASWLSQARKFNYGDGSATQYTITHNLNTRDVTVQVVRVAAPYDTVIVDVERDSLNSVVLRHAVAPSSNQFRVLIRSAP